MKAFLLSFALVLLNSCASPPPKKLIRLDTNPINGAYFTLGSDKNDVIALHGSPVAINTFKDGSEWWRYDWRAYVYFKHGEVVGWNFTDPSLPPFKAFLSTSSNAQIIAQGSSLEDVVAVMGIPTGLQVMGSGVTWVNYGDSRIEMRSGVVTGWDDRARVLKIGTLPDSSGDTIKRINELRALREEYKQKAEGHDPLP